MLITLKKDLEVARNEFEQVIQEQNSVTMLILGGGKEEAEIANLAQIRTGTLSNGIRRVIWIQNPETLSDQEKVKYGFADQDIIVSVLNVNSEPVYQLKIEEAKNIARLEKAFCKGQTL